MKNIILIIGGFVAGIVSTNIFNAYADVGNIKDEWVPSKDPAPARSYILTMIYLVCYIVIIECSQTC